MEPTDANVDHLAHPVDVIEHLASARDWLFERATADEITIGVTGAWTEYNVSIAWRDDIEALHVACAFDARVPGVRQSEVLALIRLVNEQLWLGHFDMLPGEGAMVYRHALLLSGGAGASERQCEALLASAVDACERYYQAFQFVIWAGRSAREALNAALFETVGRA